MSFETSPAPKSKQEELSEWAQRFIFYPERDSDEYRKELSKSIFTELRAVATEMDQLTQRAAALLEVKSQGDARPLELGSQSIILPEIRKVTPIGGKKEQAEHTVYSREPVDLTEFRKQEAELIRQKRVLVAKQDFLYEAETAIARESTLVPVFSEDGSPVKITEMPAEKRQESPSLEIVAPPPRSAGIARINLTNGIEGPLQPDEPSGKTGKAAAILEEAGPVAPALVQTNPAETIAEPSKIPGNGSTNGNGTTGHAKTDFTSLLWESHATSYAKLLIFKKKGKNFNGTYENEKAARENFRKAVEERLSHASNKQSELQSIYAELGEEMKRQADAYDKIKEALRNPYFNLGRGAAGIGFAAASFFTGGLSAIPFAVWIALRAWGGYMGVEAGVKSAHFGMTADFSNKGLLGKYNRFLQFFSNPLISRKQDGRDDGLYAMTSSMFYRKGDTSRAMSALNLNGKNDSELASAMDYNAVLFMQNERSLKKKRVIGSIAMSLLPGVSYLNYIGTPVGGFFKDLYIAAGKGIKKMFAEPPIAPNSVPSTTAIPVPEAAVPKPAAPPVSAQEAAPAEPATAQQPSTAAESIAQSAASASLPSTGPLTEGIIYKPTVSTVNVSISSQASFSAFGKGIGENFIPEFDQLSEASQIKASAMAGKVLEEYHDQLRLDAKVLTSSKNAKIMASIRKFGAWIMNSSGKPTNIFVDQNVMGEINRRLSTAQELGGFRRELAAARKAAGPISQSFGQKTAIRI